MNESIERRRKNRGFFIGQFYKRADYRTAERAHEEHRHGGNRREHNDIAEPNRQANIRRMASERRSQKRRHQRRPRHIGQIEPIVPIDPSPCAPMQIGAQKAQVDIQWMWHIGPFGLFVQSDVYRFYQKSKPNRRRIPTGVEGAFRVRVYNCGRRVRPGQLGRVS